MIIFHKFMYRYLLVGIGLRLFWFTLAKTYNKNEYLALPNN